MPTRAIATAFALECRALRRVREEMGLTNVKLMIPFCRTPAEGRQVLDLMAANGLSRGENGLEVYVMAEIPSNAILADEFAALFDGFSIGSNDLTQLVLGVDRDSELVAPEFDERNPAVLWAIGAVIDGGPRAPGARSGSAGRRRATIPRWSEFLVERAHHEHLLESRRGRTRPGGGGRGGSRSHPVERRTKPMEAASPLNAPVEKVMSRSVVLMLEGIPMSEARAIAVQYGHYANWLSTGRHAAGRVATRVDRQVARPPGAVDCSPSRASASRISAVRRSPSASRAGPVCALGWQQRRRTGRFRAPGDSLDAGTRESAPLVELGGLRTPVGPLDRPGTSTERRSAMPCGAAP